MSLLKGNASFSQFLCQGTGPALTSEEIAQKIRRLAFREDSGLADETMGWVSIEDATDTAFTHNPAGDDRYWLFSLRVDRRTIPGAVVRMRSAEAEKRKLAETGQRRLYLEQREAIRESIRLELANAIPPVPHIYDVIWDVNDGVVYFGSLSPAVIDNFTSLFNITFGILLRPANALLPNPGDDPASLGEEFLTWLWFKTEEQAGRIELPLFAIEASFGRRVVLMSGDGEFAERILCQGQHADLREGKEALRQGKKVAEARILITRDNNRYEFTYRASGFQYQATALPPLQPAETESDREGLNLERIYYLEMATGTMECLAEAFQALRRSDQWPGELTRLRAWVVGDE